MEIMSLKKWRLTKRDFEKVLRKGRIFREDDLILKILNNSIGRKRVGFLVSKKFFSKAVLRNKIKRKLREIMKEEFEKIKEGIDLVFIALPTIKEKELEELKLIFKNLILKAKISKK